MSDNHGKLKLAHLEDFDYRNQKIFAVGFHTRDTGQWRNLMRWDNDINALDFAQKLYDLADSIQKRFGTHKENLKRIKAWDCDDAIYRNLGTGMTYSNIALVYGPAWGGRPVK